MAGEIIPVGNNREKIILAVNRANFKPILSQVLANRQMIKNRDIGDFVGVPLEDYVRGKPHTIKVTVFFSNFKQPPFRAVKGQRFVRAQYTVPDIDRAKLTWLQIKLAAGGDDGYNWGRFRATANLSNGRQMQVYGGLATEAEERIKALAKLSTAKILTLTVAEEKEEGKRKSNKRMFKPLTRVYPNYFTVVNYEKIEVEDTREFSGINSTLLADFRRTPTEKIPLWVSKEPTNTKSIILEALRVRGTQET